MKAKHENGSGDKKSFDLPNGDLKRSRAAKALFKPMVNHYLDLTMPKITEDLLRRADGVISERLGQIPAQRLDLYVDGELKKSISRQHYLLPVVLKMLTTQDRYGNRLNVALVGPTGTGKTRMCINAAEALDCEFILQPFNPQTTKSDLMGYNDASGNYVSSSFYKAFKDGLLFIADEFDAANPAVATILNAAVSNRTVTFPNGETVTAHENFRAIFCMNTYGTGGDDRYVGRNRLDVATLDRLVYVHIPLDPGLEAALVGIPDVQSPPLDIEQGGFFENEREILHEVVSLRGAALEKRMRYEISPRSTIHAEALHRAGFGKGWIEDCCIFRGMPEADRKKLIDAASLN